MLIKDGGSVALKLRFVTTASGYGLGLLLLLRSVGVLLIRRGVMVSRNILSL